MAGSLSLALRGQTTYGLSVQFEPCFPGVPLPYVYLTWDNGVTWHYGTHTSDVIAYHMKRYISAR